MAADLGDVSSLSSSNTVRSFESLAYISMPAKLKRIHYCRIQTQLVSWLKKQPFPRRNWATSCLPYIAASCKADPSFVFNSITTTKQYNHPKRPLTLSREGAFSKLIGGGSCLPPSWCWSGIEGGVRQRRDVHSSQRDEELSSFL